MKKAIGLILIFFMCISLCACTPRNSPEPTPTPTPTPSPAPVPDPAPEPDPVEVNKLDEFFEKAKGIWVYHDETGGMYYFLALTKDAEGVSYTAGIPNSGFAFGGPVEKATRDGSKYTLTVNVPAVPDTEESSGHGAYTVLVECDLSLLDHYVLRASNHAGDGALHDFVYYWDSFEGLDWGALYASSEPIPPLDTVQADEVWAMIEGIWRPSVKQTNDFFLDFSRDSGMYYVTEGILASGYAVRTYLTDIQAVGVGFDMTLYAPEIAETEFFEGRPEAYYKVYLEPFYDGAIFMESFAGDGQNVKWVFASKDWESFDWESYYKE